MLRLILLACLLVGAQAMSSGAPTSTCTAARMTPSHSPHTAASVQSSPYGITLSTTQYSAGGTITVTLQGRETFQGFLVLALPADTPQGSPVGSFEAQDSSQSNLVQTACTDNKGITHTSSFSNENTNLDKIELKWTAPGTLAGNLIFYATFVKSYSEFWVKLPSTPVWDGVSDQPTTPDPSSATTADLSGVTDPPPLSPSVTNTDCGSTKGCYSKCEDDTCDYLVSWKKKTDTTVEFEMFGTLTSSQGYLALGLATTPTMTDVSVIACTADSQRVSKVEQFYAASKSSGSTFLPDGPITGQSNVAAVQTTASPKSMSCRFTYDNGAAKTDLDKWKDLDKQLYMFVARGGYSPQALFIHDKIPEISPKTFQLTSESYEDASGSKVNTLVKAHACIMVLAWVFCASAGIILSRYYKPMWPNTKAWGQKVWFSYHRILMLAAMFLTVAGFIVIVINAQDFPVPRDTNSSDDAHPILGLLVVIGSLLNPIIAAFRCGPQDSKRPIFNWAHWGIGTATHIFAIVSVILGCRLVTKAAVPDWLWFVAIGFTAFHVLTVALLETHTRLSSRVAKKEEKYKAEAAPSDVPPTYGAVDPGIQTEARQDQYAANGKKGDSPPHAGSGFKCAILVVYLIVVVAITIALLAVIITGTNSDAGNTA